MEFIFSVFFIYLIYTIISHFIKKEIKPKFLSLTELENLSENEFVDYIKINYDKLNSIFDNSEKSSFTEGVWYTSKYKIVTSFDDNEIVFFLNIYTRYNNKKIHYSSFGYSS